MANDFTGFISGDKAAEIFAMPQVAIKLYTPSGTAADTKCFFIFTLTKVHYRTTIALKRFYFRNVGINPVCTHLELH